jgi:polar amino acid transport system substrate-binding protein
MNKSHACLLILTLTLLRPAVAPAHEVEAVADYEKQDGALVEIVRTALQRAGHHLTVHYMPWARALVEAQHGRADLLLGAYYTAERARAMAYSEPIGQLDISLLTLKKYRIHYAKLEDLKPYRIGVIRDAAVSPAFDRAAFLNKEAVPDIAQNLSKLLLGRIELIAYKKDLLAAMIAERYPGEQDQFEFLEPPLASNPMYCVFPMQKPSYRTLLADFNQGLQQIRQDGSYQRIVQKYAVPFR